VVVLALMPVMLAVGCGPRYSREKKDTKSVAAVTPVRVAIPQPSSEVNLAAPRSGVVRAAGQVQVAFQLAGLVESVLIEQGDQVVKGQALATLDRRLFNAQHNQAAGALAQAEAALKMAEDGTRSEEIAAARAQVAALQAQAAQTNADYERAKLLFAEGVISRQSLDAAQSGSEQVTQNLAAAEQQLEMALNGPRPEQLDQARAAVQTAQGTFSQAATQLDYATLKSPTSGTVVLRNLEVGQSVAAGMPVFEIADLDSIEVRTEIPEGDLARVTPGDRAELSFPAIPGLAASGTVRSVSPNAQAATRGFPVIIELDEATTGVIPGMVALISLDYHRPPGGLVIPSRAIIDDSVFVVSGGKATRRSIEVLLDLGERAFVDGLEPDSQVLINGQHFVKDGDSVTVVDALGVEELVRLDVD